MNPKLLPWLWALVFLIIAGATRFARLGDWSFAGDEGYTAIEVGTMSTPSLEDPVMNVVPKVIPLSFALHDAGCRWFGSDEFGSRVLSATFGTLSIPLIVLLLWPSLGSRTSIIAGLLLLLWPEHLFQSQQFRFYMFAFFFTSLSLSVALLGMTRNSAGPLVAACGLGALAVLSHTICAPLLGVVFLAEVARCLRLKKWDTIRLLIVTAANLAVVADYFLRVKPLAGNMSKAEFWSPSSLYGVQSAILLIGWPVFLFAILGAVRMLNRRTSTDLFWLGGMVLWGLQTLVLPAVLPYHADYLFPLALVMLVPAAVAIELVASALVQNSKLLALTFVLVACLLPLPSVASHYSDGSRYDFRRACDFVTDQSLPTDRYAGYNCTVLNRYLPRHAENINSPEALVKLQEMRSQPGRIWIVLTRGRNPLPEDLAVWLREHTTLKKQFRKQRFDYHDYVVDVYLDTGR